MNESEGYAVFFFPQALEALGEAIKPYLVDGPAGQHVLCIEIDTGGALIEMTLQGTPGEGRQRALELMVPTSMVRMIVSARTDETFGFGPRAVPGLMATLPAVAAPAPAAEAPAAILPAVPPASDAAPVQTPAKP